MQLSHRSKDYHSAQYSTWARVFVVRPEFRKVLELIRPIEDITVQWQSTTIPDNRYWIKKSNKPKKVKIQPLNSRSRYDKKQNIKRFDQSRGRSFQNFTFSFLIKFSEYLSKNYKNLYSPQWKIRRTRYQSHSSSPKVLENPHPKANKMYTHLKCPCPPLSWRCIILKNIYRICKNSSMSSKVFSQTTCPDSRIEIFTLTFKDWIITPKR